jgi:dTMP kinase
LRQVGYVGQAHLPHPAHLPYLAHLPHMSGHIIAFEGLDQSGKQTQAELLRDWLKQEGHKARLVSFPDYGTSIGEEIARALAGERDYDPDVMQLLYVANRYERKSDLERWLNGGLILVSDRYIASSIAYGEAQGLDAGWLAEIQKFLPPPSLTIMLDIAPETAVQRKTIDRDRYERDLAMQARVRESYLAQAAASDWIVLDGERPKDAIAADIVSAVQLRLGPP